LRRTRKAVLKESAPLARFFAAAAALLFCVLPAATTVRARQAVTSATLAGRVEDANGSTLPGASVTATNVETNRSRTSVADGEGRYRFSYMPVGTYRLKAEKQGFAALTTQLTLTLGQSLDVPLVLPVSGVAESVEVNGAGKEADVWLSRVEAAAKEASVGRGRRRF